MLRVSLFKEKIRAFEVHENKGLASSSGVPCHAILVNTPFLGHNNSNNFLDILGLKLIGAFRNFAELML